MPATIPTIEPAVINAGDTAKWTKTLADYPATDGWALTYTLVNAAQRYTVTAAASGSDYLITIAAATTATYATGNYDFRGQVSKAGEVFTVATGRLTVKPTFATAIEERTQARRTLDAIEATLEGRSTSATAEYEIAGRKMKYIDVPDLLALRDRFRADVAREDAANSVGAGLADKRRVYVRFGP